MGQIVILDENTANKIAAGEVVERPASAVKELIENAMDAGAKNISVKIKNGGIRYIEVEDDGFGISDDDLEMAFERHATSKIRTADDLESILSFGFRGEALASIAAVSTVELSSKKGDADYGKSVTVQGGVVKQVKQAGRKTGTTITVKDLFYNTPARYKFLKKDSTEAGYVSDAVSNIALGNPHISFRFFDNGEDCLHTPGNGDLLSTIFSIYGKAVADSSIKIDYQNEFATVKGYAGKPEIARGNRNHQSVYINRRYIKNKTITSAIDGAYKDFLVKGKFAFVVFNIEIDPSKVDVNVHPSKMEVKFSDEQKIFSSVYNGIKNALQNKPIIQNIELKPTVNQQIEPASFIRPVEPEEKAALKPIERTTWQVAARPAAPVRKIEEVTRPVTYEQHKVEPSQIKIAEPAMPPIKEEEPTKAAAAASVFDGTRVIGQLFSTYILLQGDDEIMMIDQHAAHERIMFEDLKKKYQSGGVSSQELLAPIALQLTRHEIEFVKENGDALSKIGFSFEFFGNNSVILRGVPAKNAQGDVKAAFVEIVDFLAGSVKTGLDAVLESALHRIACKMAVKANRNLTQMEIESLIDDMKKVENPFTCPHGRPSVVRLAKQEFEKMFKRIV